MPLNRMPNRTTNGLPFPLPPTVPGLLVLPGRDAGTCWEFGLAYEPTATVDTITNLVRNLKPGHEVCFEGPGPEDSYLLVRRTDQALESKIAFHGVSGTWRNCSFDHAVGFLRPTLAHINTPAGRKYASYTIYPSQGGERQETSQVMQTIGGRVFDILVGIVVLWAANLFLNPVPLAAALAWSLGLLLFWLRDSHSLWATSVGLLIGVALGAAVHLVTHLFGRSIVPPEGPFIHVLLDAGIGLAVGALALAASLGRHLWHERRAV